MSDNIDPKAATDKLAARIAELKKSEGKTYKRKRDGALVKVDRYDGIKTKDGVSAHTFLVESPEGRWTPKATDFLAEHDETESTATATTEII